MDEVKALGYQSLLSMVGETVISEPVQIHNEEVWVDVVIVWANKRRRTLYVCGTVLGPNCWRMERLDDKVMVGPEA